MVCLYIIICLSLMNDYKLHSMCITFGYLKAFDVFTLKLACDFSILFRISNIIYSLANNILDHLNLFCCIICLQIQVRYFKIPNDINSIITQQMYWNVGFLSSYNGVQGWIQNLKLEDVPVLGRQSKINKVIYNFKRFVHLRPAAITSKPSVLQIQQKNPFIFKEPRGRSPGKRLESRDFVG